MTLQPSFETIPPQKTLNIEQLIQYAESYVDDSGFGIDSIHSWLWQAQELAFREGDDISGRCYTILERAARVRIEYLLSEAEAFAQKGDTIETEDYLHLAQEVAKLVRIDINSEEQRVLEILDRVLKFWFKNSMNQARKDARNGCFSRRTYERAFIYYRVERRIGAVYEAQFDSLEKISEARTQKAKKTHAKRSYYRNLGLAQIRAESGSPDAVWETLNDATVSAQKAEMKHYSAPIRKVRKLCQEICHQVQRDQVLKEFKSLEQRAQKGEAPDLFLAVLRDFKERAAVFGMDYEAECQNFCRMNAEVAVQKALEEAFQQMRAGEDFDFELSMAEEYARGGSIDLKEEVTNLMTEYHQRELKNNLDYLEDGVAEMKASSGIERYYYLIEEAAKYLEIEIPPEAIGLREFYYEILIQRSLKKAKKAAKKGDYESMEWHLNQIDKCGEALGNRDLRDSKNTVIEEFRKRFEPRLERFLDRQERRKSRIGERYYLRHGDAEPFSYWLQYIDDEALLVRFRDL